MWYNRIVAHVDRLLKICEAQALSIDSVERKLLEISGRWDTFGSKVLTKRLFKEDEMLEDYNVFDSVDFGNNLRVKDEDFDNSDTSYEQKIKKLKFLEQTINIPQDSTKLLDYRLPQI